MSKIMEDVKTVNSVLRTGIMLVVLGVAGYGCYWGYENLVKPRIQAQLDLAEKEKELQKVSHDLVAAQKRVETQQEEINQLEKDNQLLNEENKRLEIAIQCGLMLTGVFPVSRCPPVGFPTQIASRDGVKAHPRTRP